MEVLQGSPCRDHAQLPLDIVKVSQPGAFLVMTPIRYRQMCKTRCRDLLSRERNETVLSEFQKTDVFIEQYKWCRNCLDLTMHLNWLVQQTGLYLG